MTSVEEPPKIMKTLRELELENKLKGINLIITSYLIRQQDLETKILTEQKKQMDRNAFLGKHNREEYGKIDEALQIAKKDLIQTEASLKVTVIFYWKDNVINEERRLNWK